MPAPNPPTLAQARRYIRRIKQELGPTSPRYRAFLNVLRDYGSPDSSSTPRELIERVRDLLKGHESLLIGLESYLPLGFDESDDDNDMLPPPREGRHAPHVLLSWIEPERELDLQALSDEVHIECTHCKFCNGERNSVAIQSNEPILLCEQKGCNREYHLKCLPEGLWKKGTRSNNADNNELLNEDDDPLHVNSSVPLVNSSYEHMVYFDKEPSLYPVNNTDDGIPPGEIYCKDCVAYGSSTVLQQYFTRGQEIRSQYASSRDYVMALLERHMIDNPAGNIVDRHGKDVSPYEETDGSEVHLKIPPRSELWYAEAMNTMARTNPLEEDGGAATLVPELTSEENDAWSAAEFLIGKPIRLYCNLDNEYHNGRIIDWRTSTVYENGTMQRPRKSKDKEVHIGNLDYYGSGSISSCEFLVRFPAGIDKRKKEVLQWIFLEEHSLALGITLVRGRYDMKNNSPDKWRPAMILARSALELVPVREFLQEGEKGELFGRKKQEEAETGHSSTDDIMALASFFGGRDHEVVNLNNETKGLVTWELLEKYHILEELEGKAAGKEGAVSPNGVDGPNNQEQGTATNTKRIPVPHKMNLALSEYKEQYYCHEEYQNRSQLDFLGKEDHASENIGEVVAHTPSPVVDGECKSDIGMEKVPDNVIDCTNGPSKAGNEKADTKTTSEKPSSDESPTKEEHSEDAKTYANSSFDVPCNEARGQQVVSGDAEPKPIAEGQVINATPEKLDKKHDDESSIGIEIEEECDAGIYANYEVAEIEVDDDYSSDEMMSVNSGFYSMESFGQGSSQKKEGIKGSQNGTLDDHTEHIEQGGTVIGGKRVSVDVVRTGHRGRPRHAVSPESKYFLDDEAETNKRPPTHAKSEPEPKKPRVEPKAPASKPQAFRADRQALERAIARVVGKAMDEDSTSEEDESAAPNLNGALPRGITMRPSGKWQAQLYYAGKSRYLGVYKNRKHALTAYESARLYLFENEAAAKATELADVNMHIIHARKVAKDSITKKK